MGATLLGVALVACGGGEDGGNEEPPPPPPVTGTSLRVEVTGGDDQQVPAGSTLPVAITVRVSDSAGAAVPGATVTVRAVQGGGAVVVTPAATDAAGRSAIAWTAQSGAGLSLLEMRARRGGDSTTVSDTARVIAVASSAIVPVGEVAIPPSYGIHDTYVRDGLAFVSAWNTGLIIYDVGDGRRGGSPSRPVEVSRIAPPSGPSGVTGAFHNAWWFHNPVSGERRYVFLGQEGPGSVGSSSRGDVFVIDVGDPSAPRHVATFALAGAGTHNFWVDEPAQVLYAAYYNGGVAAIDVSGTLSGDLSSRLLARVQPGGAAETYVWGVQLHRGSLYAIDMESGFWRLAAAAGGLATEGGGRNVPERWSSDFWLHGDWAYTGTWGGLPRDGNVGDVIKVWNVAGAAPVLADSVVLAGVGTMSDLEVSADGRLLVVSTERGPQQGLYLFDLVDPGSPRQVGFAPTSTGLHTATIAEIGGRRFVFAARNPASPALEVYDVGGVR